MKDNKLSIYFKLLDTQLKGDLHYDSLMRTLYATDASVYRQLPLAVALPKEAADIQLLVQFALQHEFSLIPRAAGTSLAGQCVGAGIVVDISKYMNRILEFNAEEGWIRVQPGVIRDELNAWLEAKGYFFGPNTSTANRCMIGGMVGNNSCGSTSIVYGSTREHVLELKTILSDGSKATFSTLNAAEFNEKLQLDNLEGQLYRSIQTELGQKAQQTNIRKHFPKANIHRRNTGYAVDFLLESQPFTENGPDFNFCKLLCGSEGTLAFTTEIKLHLDPLPAPYDIVVAVHCNSINESMKATQLAMQHDLTACELMDKIILDCTKDNIEQSKNRFFIEGDPQAVLMLEVRGDTKAEAEAKAEGVIGALKESAYGYAFPKIYPPRTKAVWDLRKAGLGLLSNVPGDKKPVACIEDTAVALEDLDQYIDEFSKMMESFGQKSVYYAHAGAGELHLRPILNLKSSEDVDQFYKISEASAKLVKKYRGSLSGEHGDGRVRAAFIPMMVGKENYALFQRIKKSWDPDGIFNPGKIVDAPPMNTSLRYEADKPMPKIDTIFDFSANGGILGLAEKCNGSGDCRKLPFSGGTMCPSYQATRNEKDTTRARANTLREFLTKNTRPNPFDHPEIKTVLDLCLSCKGCTSECPSNVDMASMKAEFLHHYYQTNGAPFSARAFANINRLNGLGSLSPGITNFFLKNRYSSELLKKALGVAKQRSLPTIHKTTLRKWYHNFQTEKANKGETKGMVYLFCDEFSNYNDTNVGIMTIRLLNRLGYEVQIVNHPESGRAFISKGFLKEAQQLARQNVEIFKNIISKETPLIGIEPSAILGFKDEYPRLVKEENREAARNLGENALMVDTFLAQEIQKGRITSEQFTKTAQHVLLHGHCHQKALSSVEHSAWLLSLPENYTVEVIPSGCCGMAGSFGYEKAHYEVSMNIGELVLFPAIRKAAEKTVIAAPGTSCRHQIWDGTARRALHPVEVLYGALV